MAKEIWKDVVGYEGIYEVSNLGRLRSKTRQTYSSKYKKNITIKGKTLKPSINSEGYKCASIRKNGKSKSIKVHRLVALAFIPNPENKPQVNHINGVRDDNRLENLEWVNNSENKKHGYDIGITKKMLGEKHPMSNITKEDVINMRLLYATGFVTQDRLAEFYQMNQRSISKILRGLSWGHISGYIL